MMHCSGPITTVGEGRAIFSAFACGLCNEGFPLPVGAWDGLCYFIVTYRVCHTLGLPYNYVALVT